MYQGYFEFYSALLEVKTRLLFFYLVADKAENSSNLKHPSFIGFCRSKKKIYFLDHEAYFSKGEFQGPYTNLNFVFLMKSKPF